MSNQFGHRNLEIIMFADWTNEYLHWPCQLKKDRIEVDRAGNPQELHIGARTLTALMSSCITVCTHSLSTGSMWFHCDIYGPIFRQDAENLRNHKSPFCSNHTPGQRVRNRILCYALVVGQQLNIFVIYHLGFRPVFCGCSRSRKYLEEVDRLWLDRQAAPWE